MALIKVLILPTHAFVKLCFICW